MPESAGTKPHFRLVYPANSMGKARTSHRARLFVTFPGEPEREISHFTQAVDIDTDIDHEDRITIRFVGSIAIEHRGIVEQDA
jgi:hypothetical protein